MKYPEPILIYEMIAKVFDPSYKGPGISWNVLGKSFDTEEEARAYAIKEKIKELVV
jgi:hypothetical protein